MYRADSGVIVGGTELETGGAGAGTGAIGTAWDAAADSGVMCIETGCATSGSGAIVFTLGAAAEG